MIYIPDNLLDYFLLEDISWKVVQNVLEWTCGVAHSTAQMVAKARSINPNIQIACTRKSIPGTRLLSTAAILDGGAIIHRAGTAETILFLQTIDAACHNPLTGPSTLTSSAIAHLIKKSLPKPTQ